VGLVIGFKRQLQHTKNYEKIKYKKTSHMSEKEREK
jgi:hypothetical protein